jgi:hypothetical protein
MDKSFCFFFQKEVLSSCRCVSLKPTWCLVPHCCAQAGEVGVRRGREIDGYVDVVDAQRAQDGGLVGEGFFVRVEAEIDDMGDAEGA